MGIRLPKFRVQPEIQQRQRQVEGLSSRTEQGLNKYLVRRFSHLVPVRRFTLVWLGFLLLLIAGLIGQNFLLSGYFQTLHPVPGGIYQEGVVGTFSNASPLYATNEADATVSRLIFAGLFKYDNKGMLAGDLASGYSVDARGTTYTVRLKPELTWQDGKPLTSRDVVFTYKSIQNPDAQSPLQRGWQGIKITAPNDQTVVFRLPDPLASFIYSLTTGIVPEHVLGSIPAADLRAAEFNTVQPVGAGPFAWHSIQVTDNNTSKAQTQIVLMPFTGYQAGKPKLEEFIVHTYASGDQLSRALRDSQITGADGLMSLPVDLRHTSSLQSHSLLLKAATMTFFKTTSGVLADQKVRQALVQSANVPEIIKQLGYPTRAVREPLLSGQLAYDSGLVQPAFNLKAAQTALNADGWAPAKDGLRSKAGKRLAFNLVALNTPEYRTVTHKLQQQWRSLGVELRVQLQEPVDFQTSLTSHNYDALLYGITIGTDPDVFVYWDSSQADVRSASRLNFSEYKNTTADAALEAGRTRLDPMLRTVKYKPFLQAWQQDAPALGLYQPRVLYVTNSSLAGLHDGAITAAIDRFNNVENWQIRQAKVTN